MSDRIFNVATKSDVENYSNESGVIGPGWYFWEDTSETFAQGPYDVEEDARDAMDDFDEELADEGDDDHGPND